MNKKIKGVLGCGISTPYLKVYYEDGEIRDYYINEDPFEELTNKETEVENEDNF